MNNAAACLSRGLVALACCAVLAACGVRETPEPVPRPAPVIAVQADVNPVRWSVPGVLAAPESTPVSFRVAGQILQRHAGLGDTVRAGQVLAELDPAPRRQDLEAARAQYQAARAALDVAQRQWKRDQAQGLEQLIAQAQVDQTRAQYAQAQAQLEQTRQAYAHARDQMAYTQLLSPQDGIITAEQAMAGQNIGAGQVVYTLAWGEGLDVIVDLPERRMAALEPGQAAEVVPVVVSEQRLQARVREVAQAADPDSRSFRVKLRVEDADVALRQGMTATVWFQTPLAEGPRYTLPATALFHQDEQPAVWVADEEGVLTLQVVTVASYGVDTVTITEGLKVGQSVVVQGVHMLSVGQRVQATPYRARPTAPGKEAP